MCGGTVPSSTRTLSTTGLSPRVRGNRGRIGGCRARSGSIPACAGEPAATCARWWMARVYPRVCGGTLVEALRFDSFEGLSPRVRGNLVEVRVDFGHIGSIPACAGEPDRTRSAHPLARVYPRVCGGTPRSIRPRIQFTGLSPRVRGNRLVGAELLPAAGSIPACAGEPSRRAPARPGRRVYPRVCGGTSRSPCSSRRRSGLSPRVRGNRGFRGRAQIEPGSIPACAGEPALGGGRRRAESGLSPRVRGNLEPLQEVARRGGSIPACAGEPRRQSNRTRRLRVYPRVCGGTIAELRSDLTAKGLSPRVRGNRVRHGGRGVHGGSIPACAGEPCPWTRRGRRSRVYPRVCGGTERPLHQRARHQGLSPRVRGNRPSDPETAAASGSIPACAGEPSAAGCRVCCTGVYPRVCGGTLTERQQFTRYGGLSPRVRGNPSRASTSARPFGSIPACAGEPRPLSTRGERVWVYPRVCGGTCPTCQTNYRRRGLSPRVRGNLACAAGTRRPLGSIPACAGEPRASSPPR